MCCAELDLRFRCSDLLCIACALLDLGFVCSNPDLLLVHCYLKAVSSLLMIVQLHDKVPKAEQDGPPPCFEPLVRAFARHHPLQPVHAYNTRLQKPMLPGREQKAQELLKGVKDKKPKVGHMPRLEVPRRFYVQLDR